MTSSYLPPTMPELNPFTVTLSFLPSRLTNPAPYTDGLKIVPTDSTISILLIYISPSTILITHVK